MAKYDFHSFLKKPVSEYDDVDKAYIESEVDAAAGRIDRGLFKDNPLLMALLGARLQEEASRRLTKSDAAKDKSDAPKAPKQAAKKFWID